MPKQTYTLNNFSGGINNLKDPRDLQENELANGVDIMIDKQGAIRTRGGEADYNSTINDRAATVAPGYGLAVFESDFSLEISSYIHSGTSDVDFQVSEQSGNNSIDFNVNNESNKFPAGSIISITNTELNNGFFRVYSSASNARDIFVSPRPVEEVNTSAVVKRHLLGETLVALADAANGQVDVWQRNVGADGWASNSGTGKVVPLNLRTTDLSGAAVTLGASEDSKISYYFVDNAIRACDTNFANSSVIRHYGYVERIHFENASSNDVLIQDTFHDFYNNLNSLSPPTVAAVDTTAGAGSSGLYPTAGSGFNLSFIEVADTESTWVADTYQIATSFVYDDNQESLLYIPTSSNTFAVTAGYRLTLRVRVIKSFDERISGGRIYCRPSGSDDEPWTLLLDISLRKGARASLDADYVQDAMDTDVGTGKTGWNPLSDGVGGGETELYTELVDSLKQNLDTYDSINGYSPTIDSISLGEINDGWKSAVVANRRTFVGNVRVTNRETGQSTIYGDRIMYSMPNKFDTFPSTNFIDVVKGDAENYVKLEEYADRLLAFKQKSVQIINISSPSDTNWFLEENIKHNGVQHPAAVVRTDYGICWVNENGCYIYDGRKITNLIDNKIADTSGDNALFPPSWSDFMYASNLLGFSIVGYEKRRKQLIVMKDCSGANHTGGDYGGVAANGTVSSGDAYIYDFKTRAWTFADNAFTDQKDYTNFITDWQGNLFFGYDNSGTVEMRYWSDTSASQGKINITTRDIDFGDPSRLKKVYKVYATYRSSAEQNLPLEFAVDGTGSFSDFSTGTNVQPQGNTGGAGYLESTATAGTTWDVATFTADSIPSCQSIQFKFIPPSSGTFEINDISIEYRPIHKRVS